MVLFILVYLSQKGKEEKNGTEFKKTFKNFFRNFQKTFPPPKFPTQNFLDQNGAHNNYIMSSIIVQKSIFSKKFRNFFKNFSKIFKNFSHPNFFSRPPGVTIDCLLLIICSGVTLSASYNF